MDFKSRALEQLRTHRSCITEKFVLAGFDGFVDTICVPVGLRQGIGKNFQAIGTITEFGQRILGAAGKSTNIELFRRNEKLGGNGPIMGNAILAAGAQLKYIGAVGAIHPHPVLTEFARHSDATTLCDPAMTTAVEFTDGKVMLGMMSCFDEITYDRIVERTGGEPALQSFAARADLLALLNWTMIPHMTAILTAFVEQLLPALPARPRRFFFDLADPEKRSDDDLSGALKTISRFEKFGRVTLGLNLKEAQHVYRLLGNSPTEETEAGLRVMAARIREHLSIDTVVVHPRQSAACATLEGTFWVPGPFCEAPLITTGAGDHFNAGFSNGQLLGLSPEACLALGVCTSGIYVRTGQSPSLTDLETFLAQWK